MAGVELPRPDIGLYDDFAATRVEIPHLVGQNRKRQADKTTVLFDGLTGETAFRGEGRVRSYPLRSRYVYSEHDEMRALVDLLEAAEAADDGRLLFRTNARLVSGLDLVEVVVAFDVDEEHLGGQAWDVVFTVSTVEHSFGL